MQDAVKDMIRPIADPQAPISTTDTLDSSSPMLSQNEQPSSDSSDSRMISTSTDPHEPTISERLRDVQDATLRFFANASNETLGACAVGLCASTYLVLGRVGLVLIGAVGGVVLHATWENSHHEAKEGTEGRVEAARKRKELGLEVARRALDWRTTQRDDSQDNTQTITTDRILDFSDFQPATSRALSGFTDAVVRDYVKWWYSPILPAEDAFPATCRQTLTSFIISFSNHLGRKRTADPFLDFIANATSMIIVFLDELASAIKASPNQSVEDAINTYLQYSPDSSLANVLSTQQQERKLNLVADDILHNFLEKTTYSCGPARTFLREVLASLILKATVDNCARAEWINGWIVYMLEDGEPEIMNAIDASVEDMGQGIATGRGSETQLASRKPHQRRVSKAEEAMEEAMREAHRINTMIAEEEARRRKSEAASDAGDTASSAPDIGMTTPSSSGSELHRITPSMESSMVFDSEGNAMPSGANSPAKVTSPPKGSVSKFTSIDQLTPQAVPTALQTTTIPPPPTEVMLAVPLTLHGASITILDMGASNDKVVLKQKPNEEMLVQIEPASSRFPGWMVTRKYADFEPLHETLRRIAVISGIPDFSQQYANVPNWKGLNRASLVGDLETYLRSALKHERLAESEAMKKFLEKDTGLDRVPAVNKNVILQGAAALDNVGKGFINVLGQGSKGIAGGGKAVLGGVQGVFGAVTTGVGGPKKPSITTRPSQAGISRVPTNTSPLASARQSQDFTRSSVDVNETRRPSLMSRRSGLSFEENARMSISSMTGVSQESLNLPPPPSEITDEFVPVSRQQTSRSRIETESPRPTSPMQASRPATPSTPSTPAKPQLPVRPSQPGTPERASTRSPAPAAVSKNDDKKDEPLTEEETRITVDLMFAIITSTYSLSSAWTIRLSLLSAAKTFLLRPNNPQLDSIRTLLQESLISANTSDAAIAAHINKLRENSLPTEQELAKWPKPMDNKEKEALRIKARKLLVERGMPQALTSVMGQAASGESLGKVFDCLQVEKVARGLMFAIMLQGIRAALQ